VTRPGLRIGFAGTPELAAIVLARVLGSGRHTVDVVYTQPDRPAGRGRLLTSSPVKQLALRHGIAIEQPRHANDMDSGGRLRGIDVLLVAAFGLFLPERVLALPRLGAINVHTSLLPRWRGAAPIQRAIQAGDTETGISIMKMDAGLDTGPILMQVSTPILREDTAGSLQDRLAALGADCALKALDLLAAGTARAAPQDAARATRARKIMKSEARIDWREPAVRLARTVRAFIPWPVCHAVFEGSRLRIFGAVPLTATAPAGLDAPGTICDVSPSGLDIATGDGILRLTEAQLPGRKRMSARDLINAHYDWMRPGTIAE
jgi:methionyl-tRNA formyltransferase